jgi:hypothetical protein
MDQIKVEISVDFIEDLFRDSLKCRDHLACTTTILELKHSVEKYIEKVLMRGCSVSVTDGFDSAIDDILYLEDDWEEMEM